MDVKECVFRGVIAQFGVKWLPCKHCKCFGTVSDSVNRRKGRLYHPERYGVVTNILHFGQLGNRHFSTTLIIKPAIGGLA
jgi:hypothetical protein